MQLTARLKIPYPNIDGSDTPVDIPEVWYNRAVILDTLTPIGTGSLSDRPVSSPSSPGLDGRLFIVLDQPNSPRLDLDVGTEWITVGPVQVDGPASVASSRTLGVGPTQACAGNDPRLVGGSTASGDISGEYPGPLIVTSWGGQTKGQVVAGSPPQAHAGRHQSGGADALINLTDSSFAAANKDGLANVPSLRTLGSSSTQAQPGNLHLGSIARAYMNSAPIIGEAWQLLSIDTVSSDVGGNFDLSRWRYVCPWAGFYLVTGNISGQVNNNPQDFRVGLYKNARSTPFAQAGIMIRGGTTGDIEQVSVMDIISCNAGDYLQLYAYNGGPQSIQMNASDSVNFISICCLAKTG